MSMGADPQSIDSGKTKERSRLRTSWGEVKTKLVLKGAEELGEENLGEERWKEDMDPKFVPVTPRHVAVSLPKPLQGPHTFESPTGRDSKMKKTTKSTERVSQPKEFRNSRFSWMKLMRPRDSGSISSPKPQTPDVANITVPRVSNQRVRRGRKIPLATTAVADSSVNSGSWKLSRFSWTNILRRRSSSVNSVASRKSDLMPAFGSNSDISNEIKKEEAKRKYLETKAAQVMQQQGLPEPKRRDEFPDEKAFKCCIGFF